MNSVLKEFEHLCGGSHDKWTGADIKQCEVRVDLLVLLLPRKENLAINCQKFTSFVMEIPQALKACVF